MRALDTTALVLVVIGAINWGMIGLFNYDLVSAIFGTNTILTRIIFTLVGVCGLYAISFFARDREISRES